VIQTAYNNDNANLYEERITMDVLKTNKPVQLVLIVIFGFLGLLLSAILMKGNNGFSDTIGFLVAFLTIAGVVMGVPAIFGYHPPKPPIEQFKDEE
jgi:hypothetical protein